MSQRKMGKPDASDELFFRRRSGDGVEAPMPHQFPQQIVVNHFGSQQNTRMILSHDKPIHRSLPVVALIGVPVDDNQLCAGLIHEAQTLIYITGFPKFPAAVDGGHSDGKIQIVVEGHQQKPDFLLF